MLEFNVGELVTRLRRALGVRGRMPLGLDEHVIPVTLTADVSVPPWRTNPVYGQGGAYDSCAINARRAFIQLAFRSVAANIPQRNSVFVLKGLSVQPMSFLTATPGTSAPVNQVDGFFKPLLDVAVSLAGKLVTTERSDAIGASLAPYELPIELRTANAAGISSALPTTGRIGLWRSGVVQPAVWFPSELLLRYGQSVDFYGTAASGTETSALAVTVQGLFYGLGG